MCNLSSVIFERFERELNLKFLRREGSSARVFSLNTERADENLYSRIIEIIEDELRSLRNGEYQRMEISGGENVDSGIKQAEILRGVCYEIYCFNCLSMCYLRVLWERGLFYKREWISVDSDEILNSPWFLEE
ncbi:MAG: hypothetical protein H5T46_03500 [Archaeoglobi archaeon]|nr:hypothetical protein [Candidatus Mnemosynella sp.]